MKNIKDILDDETIKTLKGTVEFLAENGLEITQLFYKKLFSANPELKNVFNLAHQKNGEQQQALARAVYGFAANLDDLDRFSEQLSRIANKHCSLNIQADKYPIIGKNLLLAIHEIVSEKLDESTADTITAAWEKGYWIFANLLIEREQKLYEHSQDQPGGWNGLREFSLDKREDESSDVTSFYIKPVDNKPLPTYQPGQYISIHVKPKDAEYQQIRQYSLSNSYSKDYYRITVKREGIISNYIHDNWAVGEKIYITPPAGDFNLQENNNPIVLLSAGIGVTPIISLLKTVLEKRKNQNVTFVHAVKNSNYHPFKKFINTIVEKYSDSFNKIVFYEEPLESDVLNEDFNHQGLIDFEKIKENINQSNTDYYLCGPVPFMRSIHKTITTWGVDEANIYYEVFGANKSLYNSN